MTHNALLASSSQHSRAALNVAFLPRRRRHAPRRAPPLILFLNMLRRHSLPHAYARPTSASTHISTRDIALCLAPFALATLTSWRLVAALLCLLPTTTLGQEGHTHGTTCTTTWVCCWLCYPSLLLGCCRFHTTHDQTHHCHGYLHTRTFHIGASHHTTYHTAPHLTHSHTFYTRYLATPGSLHTPHCHPTVGHHTHTHTHTHTVQDMAHVCLPYQLLAHTHIPTWDITARAHHLTPTTHISPHTHPHHCLTTCTTPHLTITGSWDLFTTCCALRTHGTSLHLPPFCTHYHCTPPHHAFIFSLPFSGLCLHERGLHYHTACRFYFAHLHRAQPHTATAHLTHHATHYYTHTFITPPPARGPF